MNKSKISSFLLTASVATSVAVIVAACGGSSSGDSTTNLTTNEATAVASYAGPGSKWDVVLNDDDTFEITRSESIDAAVGLTVNGTYSKLESGFLKLTVSSAEGENAPSAGDIAYALDVPNYAFFLKPLDAGSDQVIAMVKAGACPTEDVLANWVMVKSDGAADDANRDFFGTFSYDVSTDTPDLPSKYNLSAFGLVSGGGISGTGSCSDGIMSVEGAAMYLTDNGGAIVHLDNNTAGDETDDNFVFALNQAALDNNVDTDGTYAGLLFDGSVGTDGERISPVSMDCASLVCTAYIMDDVEANSRSEDSVLVSMTTTNDPEPGMATGTINDGGASPGQLACALDATVSSGNGVVITCVGQSPGDNSKMFNVLFVKNP